MEFIHFCQEGQAAAKICGSNVGKNGARRIFCARAQNVRIMLTDNSIGV